MTSDPEPLTDVSPVVQLLSDTLAGHTHAFRGHFIDGDVPVLSVAALGAPLETPGVDDAGTFTMALDIWRSPTDTGVALITDTGDNDHEARDYVDGLVDDLHELLPMTITAVFLTEYDTPELLWQRDLEASDDD